MPSFVGEPPLLLAADGAVLWRPWEERGADIQGRWAEDGSPYTVDVPAPLQGVLLNLQRRLSAEWNRLYDGAARLRTRPVAQPPEDVDGLPLQVAELHGCLAGWVEGAPDINFDSPGNRGWLGALQKRSAAALEASRKTVARLRAAGRLLVAVLLLAAIGHADDAVPHAWPYYPDPAARARLAVLDATPDTRTVTDAELCRAGSTRDARLVTASMKTKVFQAYGITKDFGGYEIDHFISLELGGANALSNLWPQPYGGVSFTARMKDVVETSLHRRACRGELTFDAAREVIRTDWIAEYQRVMATRKAKPAKRTK